MDCRTFCRKLEDHLEGGLDFPGRFGMERHAEQCFECGKVYTDALRLRRMAREVQQVNAPLDFEAAVLARIQTEGGRNSLPGLGWLRFYDFEWLQPRAWAMGAAAALLVGMGVLLYMISGTSDPIASLNQANMREGANSAGETEDSHPLYKAVNQEFFTPNWVLEGELGSYGSAESSGVESLSTEAGWFGEFNESAAQDYVEYIVPGPGDGQWIMRLPRTIRMRQDLPSEDYFIRNVSH